MPDPGVKSRKRPGFDAGLPDSGDDPDGVGLLLQAMTTAIPQTSNGAKRYNCFSDKRVQAMNSIRRGTVPCWQAMSMKQKQILILLVSIVALTGMIAWEASIYLGPSKNLPQPAGADFITTRFMLPQQPTSEFPIKTVREAWDVVKPEELVLGVTVGQESRAYP